MAPPIDPAVQAVIDEIKNSFESLRQEMSSLRQEIKDTDIGGSAGQDETRTRRRFDQDKSFSENLDEHIKQQFENNERMAGQLDSFGESFGTMLIDFNENLGKSLFSNLANFSKSFNSSMAKIHKDYFGKNSAFNANLEKFKKSSVHMQTVAEPYKDMRFMGDLRLLFDISRGKADLPSELQEEAKKNAKELLKAKASMFAGFLSDMAGMVASFFTKMTLTFATTFLQKLQELTISVFDFATSLQRNLGVSESFSRNMIGAFEASRRFGIGIADIEKATSSLFTTFTNFTFESASTQRELALIGSILEKNKYPIDAFSGGIQTLTKTLGISSLQAAQTQADLLQFGMNIGVTPETMSKQFGQATESIAKLGDTGVRSFQRLAVAAKVTGMEVSRILAITDQFDTFEGAAQATGKLNAALGGNFVNAMDMMMATDPAERFGMIRDTLQSAGLEFDNMTYFQKNFFKETLGLKDVSELSLLMSGNIDLLSGSIQQSSAEIEDLAKRGQEIQKFSDLIKNLFANLIPVLKPVVIKMTEFARTISEGKGFDKFKETIPKITGALSALTVGISAFAGAFQIVLGILLMFTGVGVAGGLPLVFTGIGTAAGGAAAGLSGLAASFAMTGDSASVAEDLMSGLGEIFSELKSAFSPLLDAFDKASGTLADNGGAIKSFTAVIVGFIKAMKPLIFFFSLVLGLAVRFGAFLTTFGEAFGEFIGLVLTFSNPLAGFGRTVRVVGAAISFLGEMMGFMKDEANKKASPSFVDIMMNLGSWFASAINPIKAVAKVVQLVGNAFKGISTVVFSVQQSLALMLQLADKNLAPIVDSFQAIESAGKSIQGLSVQKIQLLTTTNSASGNTQTQKEVIKEVIRDVKFVIGDREFKEVVDPIADARFNKLSTSFIV